MSESLRPRSFGDPARGRKAASAFAERVEIQRFSDPVLERFLAGLSSDSIVGDIGGSSRDGLSRLRTTAQLVEVLDIDGAPDVLIDLCQELPLEMRGRYDGLFCSSVLEHVYDPFKAASNLIEMLRPGGVLMGSTPWLFPYHPSPGHYEDFWRFSPTAYGGLFHNASRIVVSPTRGRLATVLVVLTLRYKHGLEKRLPKLGKRLAGFWSEGRHEFQTSGFEFEIWK